MSPSLASISEAAPVMARSGSPITSPSQSEASSRRVKLTARGRRRGLLFHAGADLVQRSSRTKLLVFAGDEIGVGLHEDFARRAKIELGWFIAEKFAMHTRPNQSPVGVDVHLGYAEFGRREIFILVH